MQFSGTRLILCALHLVLIFAVSCADTFDLLGSGTTLLPRQLNDVGRKGKAVLFALIGRQSRVWNPARPILRAYLNCAGIEAGYSFFAPNVPNSYKLVFELYYPDGHVDHDVLGGEARETDLRIASLLDEVGTTTSDPLREVMIKLLAYSVWQFHPDAIKMRAILGSLQSPTITDFRSGRKRSDVFLYAYDFSFAETSP